MKTDHYNRSWGMQTCPWTGRSEGSLDNHDECATMRERSVAGKSNDIPACPVHNDRIAKLGSCPRCIYGPHVLLLPERGAATLQTTMLAEGRVVARLINSDAEAYPKFNLAPHDTVYWWVDRRGTGDTWRSVYVSSDPARRLQPDTLVVTSYHGYAWQRTLARFLWRDTDEALWVACDMTGCCRSSGADLY